jgi:hypothetical protein
LVCPNIFLPGVPGSDRAGTRHGVHLAGGFEFRNGQRGSFLELEPVYHFGGSFLLGLRLGRTFCF